MSAEPALNIVLGAHGQVAALKDGRVRVDGVTLNFLQVKPMTDAYRRMARDAAFDISELAPTTYLAAKAKGAPITALPIPMTRRFRHAGMMLPENSPIREPRNLEGKKVGVRAYTVTAGVWTRGVLQNEFGLDISKVTWVVDDEEHVLGLDLPSNVVQAPRGRSLAQMFVDGELDAGFAGIAGIGTAPEGRVYHDLFPDPKPLEAAWFKKTGIYPIHGVIAVRNDVLDKHPSLPKRLYDAFVAAKKLYLDAIMSGAADDEEDKRYRKLADLVGDPLPYGMADNRASLDALVQFAQQQGFLPARYTISDLFLDPLQ
ncbi:MAG: ABC transporter substrate-binding protein [Caulobacterales bacterium]|nr:ABC transporter substrate-binding protein [Caulobacterales bacterium]